MRQKQRVFSLFLLSPSSRRAWIEIAKPTKTILRRWVALLAEGVDRNNQLKQTGLTMQVALLAEGVDRNTNTAKTTKKINVSPSSRRAWIEIFCGDLRGKLPPVALHAEGVDRNVVPHFLAPDMRSRPPRGGRG